MESQKSSGLLDVPDKKKKRKETHPEGFYLFIYFLFFLHLDKIFSYFIDTVL